ncbi:MAG: hypothetical protein NT154_35935 [Verrucomicrobia bacterium]|nr:hypothetical protein [Verrucomicrobiota bacterium]
MKKPTTSGLEENWQWPATGWSDSGHLPSTLGRNVSKLNELILRYQAPLKAYLLAAFPGLVNEADELLQDFAQDRILREGWLRKADQQRGRFRDFLKISLKNFVRDRLSSRVNAPISLEELECDLASEAVGEETFDLEWGRAILTEVLTRMEQDCRTPQKNQPNRPQIWEVFRLRLLQPILEGAQPVGYEELVSKLGIVSPFAAQNLLATAKRMFERHLNEVIGEYEAAGEAAKVEVEELKKFLAGLSHKKNH